MQDYEPELSKHSTMLEEFYDTVVIITTRLEQDGTTTLQWTQRGNQFAVKASIDEMANRLSMRSMYDGEED